MVVNEKNDSFKNDDIFALIDSKNNAMSYNDFGTMLSSLVKFKFLNAARRKNGQKKGNSKL